MKNFCFLRWVFCVHLSLEKSVKVLFSDLRKSFEPKDIERLKKVYRNVDDIDLYVGGFLEVRIVLFLFSQA